MFKFITPQVYHNTKIENNIVIKKYKLKLEDRLKF